MHPTHDQELFDLILAVEDELLEQGFDVKRRHFQVPINVMRRLGFDNIVVAGRGQHPIQERVRELQTLLYRKKDIAMGGLHGGVFMFRGIVARIDIPIFFGSIAFEPFKMSDLSDHQVKWLCSKQSDADAYISAFADVFDFAASIHPMGDYQLPPEGSREYLTLASFQMQSAAATLVGAFDTRGAIQSAIIGAELALKAALIGAGYNDEQLKKLGHDIDKIVGKVAVRYPGFNLEAVRMRIEVLPHYVHNRYSPQQPDRVTTGAIVMAAQFVCGEVARILTKGSFASKLVKE